MPSSGGSSVPSRILATREPTRQPLTRLHPKGHHSPTRWEGEGRRERGGTERRAREREGGQEGRRERGRQGEDREREGRRDGGREGKRETSTSGHVAFFPFPSSVGLFVLMRFMGSCGEVCIPAEVCLTGDGPRCSVRASISTCPVWHRCRPVYLAA